MNAVSTTETGHDATSRTRAPGDESSRSSDAPAKEELDATAYYVGSVVASPSPDRPLQPAQVLALQRAAGNQAVQRAFARTAVQREPNQSVDENVCQEDMIKVAVGGKTVLVPKSQEAALKKAALAKARSALLPKLRSAYAMHTGYVGELKLVNDDNRVIAWICEQVGDVDFQFVLDVVDDAGAAAAHAEEVTFGNDPGAAHAAILVAEESLNNAGSEISKYVEGIDVGGKAVIEGLDTVVKVSIAIEAACLAALIAPVVVTSGSAVGTAVVEGSAGAAIETILSGAYEAGVKDDDRVTAETVLSDAVIKGIVGGATGGVAKGLVTKLSPSVTNKIVAALSQRMSGGVTPALREVIEAAVDDGIGDAIKAAIANSGNLASGKMTWDQFTAAVATALVTGAAFAGVKKKMEGKDIPEDVRTQFDKGLKTAVEQAQTQVLFPMPPDEEKKDQEATTVPGPPTGGASGASHAPESYYGDGSGGAGGGDSSEGAGGAPGY